MISVDRRKVVHNSNEAIYKNSIMPGWVNAVFGSILHHNATLKKSVLTVVILHCISKHRAYGL